MKLRPPSGRRLRSTRELLLAIIVVAVVATLGLTTPGFLSARNLTLLANDRVHIGILAVGMTLVILTAGIDLSVGSTVALSGMAFGLAWQRTHGNLAGALAAGLLVGLLAGAINGALVAGARVPALIVTLATLSVYRGLAQGVAGGASVSGFAPGFVELAQRRFLALPLPAWGLLVLFLVTGVFLARAEGGRQLYALGANSGAARLAGVPVARISFLVYLFSGLMAALAALTYAALNDTIKADVGKGYELDAITIAVLGGTGVAGGEGSMVGTALALVLVSVGLNGMDLHAIPRERQSMVVAGVLVLSLWIDSRLRRFRR